MSGGGEEQAGKELPLDADLGLVLHFPPLMVTFRIGEGNILYLGETTPLSRESDRPEMGEE